MGDIHVNFIASENKIACGTQTITGSIITFQGFEIFTAPNYHNIEIILVVRRQ